MPRWPGLFLVVGVVGAACAACGPGLARGSASGPTPGAETPEVAACRIALAPPSAPAPPVASRPGSALAVPRSTLVVNAELALTPLARALEAKVPRRVAEERDHDIGVAGRLEYTVDRGPFAVSVQGDALVVETPLVGHARACAKGRCYAGCDPEMRVTARVPLRLNASYRLGPSDVRIDVTRGCEVRAMGGFVKVDVTPTLSARLAQERPRLQQSIDRELPDLKPEAERLWAELSRPRALPLGACVVLAPEGLVEGPSSGTSGTAGVAHLRFGVLARPEIRMRCTEALAPKAAPLPPLGADPALPAEGDVRLAIVLPPESAASALEGVREPVELGAATSRVHRVTGDAQQGFVLELAGEVCGEVRASASGAAWADDGRAIHLTGAALADGEEARLAASGLEVRGVTKLVERASVGVPIAVRDLGAALPELARALSDDRVTVSAHVIDARPDSAGLRGAELVAVARLRGAVTVQQR